MPCVINTERVYETGYLIDLLWECTHDRRSLYLIPGPELDHNTVPGEAVQCGQHMSPGHQCQHPATFMRLPAKLFPSDGGSQGLYSGPQTRHGALQTGCTLYLGTSRVCTPPPPVSKHSPAPSLKMQTNIREVFTVLDQGPYSVMIDFMSTYCGSMSV